MAATLATGAYRRAVDRAHESLSTAPLQIVVAADGPAPDIATPADEGLRAALQGLRREVRESWLRSLAALAAPAASLTSPGDTPPGPATSTASAAPTASVARRLPGDADPATLSHAELTAARHEQRLAAALPIVRRMLVEPAREAGLLVAVGNERGHLLWVEGDRTALTRAETMGFVAGADWSEASMGTSAPGVVLATGAPMQVSRAEHLSPRVHPWNCSAVPLTDPVTGRLVGVLDLTGGDDAVSPLALPLLQSTADAVHAAWLDLPAPFRGTPVPSFPTTAPPPPSSASPESGPAAGAPGASPASEAPGPSPTPGTSPAPDASPAPAPPGPHRHDDTASLLRVTGHLPPMLDGVQLTGRHAEILTLLAWHPAGLTGAELEAALYPEEGAAVGKRAGVKADGGRRAQPAGDAARAISLRAEVHRLRRSLGDAGAPVEVLSRPYRLAGDVHTDALCARDALRAGDLDRALHAAAGPVLPRSESPGISAIRAELGEGLREAVAEDADIEQLWAYLARPEAREDVELWGAALKLLPADSPRRALAVATLERLEREIG
jgi:hypothetical protein